MSIQSLPKLLLNHADAWGVTFIISSVALLVHDALTPENLILPLVVASCYWLGFALNDYFDAPFDAQDEQKGRRNFFVVSPVSRPVAAVGLALVVLALLAVFARYGERSIIVMVTGCLAMWLYSAPPFRLKSRPVFDLLMHVFFVQTFPYSVSVYLLGLSWSGVDMALFSVFALASFSAQLEQQVRDYEVDARTEQNFTTVYGLQTSSRLLKAASALLFINFAGQVLLGVIPSYLVPFGLAFLPVLLHRFWRGADAPRSETLVRVSLVLALAYAGFVLVGGYAYLMDQFIH